MGERQFRALRDQAQYSDQDLQQVCQVFLRAWRHIVPTGHAQPSFTKTLQGPNEPYTDFLARLWVAVEGLLDVMKFQRYFYKHLLSKMQTRNVNVF